MLEYVFFEPSLRDQFIAFLREHGVTPSSSEEAESLIVGVPEDVSDELSDAIDERYEKLLQAHTSVMDGVLEHDAAGVQIVLMDGSTATVRLDPELVGRLLQAVRLEELRDLVQDIAEQVQNPDNRPLCHK